MAQLRNKKIKIGMIGCDTFHTPVLLEQFQNHLDVEVVWVDKTYRTSLEASYQRQPRFEAMIDGKVNLVELDLKNHEPVDFYCILTLDASLHLEIINTLSVYQKPIFVDKPIFYNLEDFNQLKTKKIMSSSGLRFCDFVKEVKASEPIFIEGPLSFVEDIEGYFFYGIHLVEMLQTITKAPIKVESVFIDEKYELIKGQSGEFNFELKGIKVGDPAFCIRNGDKYYELSSYDHLYNSLAKAIIEYDYEQDILLRTSKIVIETILEMNKLRKKGTE